MISKLRCNNDSLQNEELPFAYQTDLIENFSFEQLKEYVTQLKKEKESFEKLTKRFDDLSPKQFFKLYKNFYCWDTNKIKQRLIKANFGDFEQVKVLTNDIVCENYKEGYGSYALWQTNYYYANYILIAKKALIDPNKAYTKSEISRLVKQKKVLVKQIEVSSEYIIKNSKDLYQDIANLSMIDITSRVDFLANGFFKSPNQIAEADLSEMNKQCFDALLLIKQQFSKNRLKKSFQTYKKQFELAKDKCFKKAYNLIRSSKNKDEKYKSKVAVINDIIQNL